MTQGVLLTLLLWGVLDHTSAPDAETSRSSGSQELREVTRALSGAWNIEFTISPNEALPKGGKGRGIEVWHAGPGALSLIEDYHSQGDDGESTGHGIFWFDDDLHRFQVVWCANDVPSGCMAISDGATWKRGQLALQHRWQSNGAEHIMKEVFSDISPTSFTQTVYTGTDPRSLTVQYVIHASKRARTQ